MQQILITSLTAGLVAQLSKFFIKSNKIEFKRRYLWSYSGMPSSHAAITSALTASVGLSQGVDSPLFAACLIFTLLVIRDAVGLRRYLGIGHTWPQILAGCLVGLLISLIGYLL